MMADEGLGVQGSTGHVFTNWSGTLTCRPQEYFEPSNVTELRQILSRAQLEKRKVTTVGKGHSFSPLIDTEDYLVCLRKMNSILEIDPVSQTVTAEAGITMIDLMEALKQQGLALSVFPAVKEVHLGGVIATGSHGTGARYTSLSSLVEEIVLLTSTGELLTLSEDSDPDVFGAARLSLGALGIIITIKMRCEKDYDVSLVVDSLPLQQLLETLSVHKEASDHFSFMWFPHTDGAVTYHVKRAPVVKRDRSPSGWLSWILPSGDQCMQFLYWIGLSIPWILPYASRFYYWRNSGRVEITARADEVLTTGRLMQESFEWAIPVEKTALVLYELKMWITNNKYPAHFPVFVRFSKADDVLLSPARGRDVSYINLGSVRPYGRAGNQHELFEAFAEIALRAGGRIHWAKMCRPSIFPRIPTMYPDLGRFLEVRRKLDPVDLFWTPNLQRMLNQSSSNSD